MSSFAHSPKLFLKSLFVKNFRNLSEVDISFGPGHNLFIGLNGQGKTNCLEAIAMACSLKPMQALQNIDLIRFDESQARIIAVFDETHKRKVEIDVFEGGKKAKVNGEALKKASHLSNACPLVFFIPAELQMISGSAALRRRALDQAAAAFFFEHISALKAYDKLLLHRNRLLKDWPIDKNTLHSFTELFIQEGARVAFYRLKAIEQITGFFAEKIREILGPSHEGRIAYHIDEQEMGYHTIADIASFLLLQMTRKKNDEFKRRVTLFGPHLDDIAFFLNERNARQFASRGQCRTIALSFKLAHMIAIHQIRGVLPIIILDDIVSELDAKRKESLLDVVMSLKAQAFFSATDMSAFGRNTACDRIFHIDRGSIIPQQPES